MEPYVAPVPLFFPVLDSSDSVIVSAIERRMIDSGWPGQFPVLAIALTDSILWRFSFGGLFLG